MCILEARTFGHHFLKRISFAIIPGAFVIGAVTTLLAALTVVSTKGLGVGVSSCFHRIHCMHTNQILCDTNQEIMNAGHILRMNINKTIKRKLKL